MPYLVEPVFILVRPQMGENIGAAARAMLNFGLMHMRIVAPRDGWPNPKATAMASGAGRLLEYAGVFPDVASAIVDCHAIFATTARSRDLIKETLNPETTMQRSFSLAQQQKRVAILFGPERTGLENPDLLHANAFVNVPVNPEFPSLNLAQCVLLMGYEWRRAMAAPVTPDQQTFAGRDLAQAADIEVLATRYETALESTGFFFPLEKATPMRQNMRNMWARLGLTRSETQIFHGILRHITRR